LKRWKVESGKVGKWVTTIATNWWTKKARLYRE